MTACELCGKEGQLFRAVIEGTELEVCESCGSFGRVERKHVRVGTTHHHVALPPELEQNEIIVENFALLVKQAREKMGLKQQELAQKINEKVSVIHHLETGHEPPMMLARKLEKMLHIKLVSMAQEATPTHSTKSEGMTIGDIVNVKGR